MSHTSVSGTENSLLSQTCSAQKSPVSGVSTTTADLLCQWLVEARRRSSVSRFRHACGVLQYHHQTFLNSEVSWEKTAYQPFRHACPLSGNVLILVVQVGFVSSPFVKLDRMLSFFQQPDNEAWKLGFRQKKANFDSPAEEMKAETTLAGSWFATAFAVLNFVCGSQRCACSTLIAMQWCSGRVVVPVWTIHKLIR